MASVKQECESDSIASDDNWLFEWSNPQNHESVKVEANFEIKSELIGNENSENSNMDVKIHRKTSITHKIQKERATPRISGEDIGEKLKNKLGKRNVLLHGKDDILTKSLQWKEALKQAEVSDAVANLCEFQCPKCNVSFAAKKSLYVHLRTTKHATSSKNKNVNTYVTKIVAHECHICSKRLLCDKTVILSHIKNSHKIRSLNTYNDRASCFEHLSKKTKTKIEFKDFKEKLKPEQKHITKKVGSLCEFSCLHCHYSCKNWTSMKRHIKDFNHGPLLSIIKYVTNAIFHRCFICNELVFCDLAVLSLHQHNRHQLKISKYKKLINVQNSDYTMQQYLSTLRSCIESIPVIAPKPKKVLKHDAIPDQCVTKNSGNLSFFKCCKCDKSNMSFTAFRQHWRRKHKMKSFSFNRKNVAKACYHKCHICSKVMLCDNKVISGHVLAAHKMTLPMYQTEYVLKSGHKVFPTFKEYQKNNQVLKPFEKGSTSEATEKCKMGNRQDLITPSMLSSESEDSD